MKGESKQRILLRVQPIYSTVLWIVLAALFFACLFLPVMIDWDMTPMFTSVYYAVLGAIVAVCLAFFVYYMQFASVGEDGITLYVLFFKLAEIKWEYVGRIEQVDLLTYRGRSDVKRSWLVIHAKYEREDRTAGRNRKTPPWYIICTDKNKFVVQSFYDKEIENV